MRGGPRLARLLLEQPRVEVEQAIDNGHGPPRIRLAEELRWRDVLGLSSDTLVGVEELTPEKRVDSAYEAIG